MPFIEQWQAAGSVAANGSDNGSRGAVPARTGTGVYTLTLDRAADATETLIKIDPQSNGVTSEIVHTSDTVKTITFRKGGSDLLYFPQLSANAADADVEIQVLMMSGLCTLIRSILVGGALATGNATVQAAKFGVGNMADGLITVTQAGSAAGDVDSAAPTTNNSFAVGGAMSLTVAGSATGNRFLNCVALIDQTASPFSSAVDTAFTYDVMRFA